MEDNGRGEGGYKGRDQESSEGVPMHTQRCWFEYEHLCIHQSLTSQKGSRLQNLILSKSGDIMVHLRAYCYHLIGVGRDKDLLMRLFSRSLCGEAL